MYSTSQKFGHILHSKSGEHWNPKAQNIFDPRNADKAKAISFVLNKASHSEGTF